MTAVKGAHRTWCYTINNYTDDEIDKLKVLTVKMHRCAKEVGENGTPHLQGAITFERTYRMAALKKLFPRAHWKPGKTCDPENYCIKGEIIIDTVNREQGKRTDLAEAIEVGRTEGYREMAIAHPETFVKYHRGLKELLFTIEEPKEWYDTKVYIFWGLQEAANPGRQDKWILTSTMYLNQTMDHCGLTGTEVRKPFY